MSTKTPERYTVYENIEDPYPNGTGESRRSDLIHFVCICVYYVVRFMTVSPHMSPSFFLCLHLIVVDKSFNVQNI